MSEMRSARLMRKVAKREVLMVGVVMPGIKLQGTSVIGMLKDNR